MILSAISIWVIFPGCSYQIGGVEYNIFRGLKGIFTIVEPADTAVYRKILPDIYDMPETPLVAVFAIDYYDMERWMVQLPAESNNGARMLPLVPYHEASILLSCVYEGTTGWCPMTMPVSDQAANAAGRKIGFPKYVADHMYLNPTAAGWVGETIHDGKSVIFLEFAQGPVDTGSLTGWQRDFMTEARYINFDTPVINMVPPLEGPNIRTNIPDPPALRERKTGMLTIDLGRPWDGLIPDNTVAPGFYQRFDIDPHR